MQKYLGVDIGQKKVGVAVSDDEGSVAFPLTALKHEGCVEQLLTLIAERGITTVVFGESLNLDGTANPIMKEVQKIADVVRKKAEVVFEPEQFSTQAAARLGKGTDAEAATIILQSHLDKKNRGKEEVIDFE